MLDAARAELLESGYAALSHGVVARRAGVDPATVYRRWPTRGRLATDALLEIARTAVTLPDTGSLAGDLDAFLGSIAAALVDPRILRLFHALSASGVESDPDLAGTLRTFWHTRFASAETLVTRAVKRGELPPAVDAHTLIEQLIAPVYFRALITGEPIDDALVERQVGTALTVRNSARP